MQTRRLIVYATMAAALTGALLPGCGLHGRPRVARKAATAAAPRADTDRSAAGDSIPRAQVIAPGIVEPWGAEVELAAQEPGRIAAIAVREGEVVSAGQLIATLEDEAQGRARDLARAELAEAEAELSKTERGATPEELRRARADFDAAVARRDFARSVADRNSRLEAGGVLPQVDRDRADAEAATQAAIARSAEARLQELTVGSRAEDRSAARARVAAAQARLQMAEADLARRRITAPGAGTIMLSRYHAGEFYTPGAGPLFILGDLTRLQVRLEVDEIDAPDVLEGAPCALCSDGGLHLAGGTVARLAPRMGRRTLPLESPTARVDVRIREVFVEVPATARLVPGERVWGYTPRSTRRNRP